MDLGQDPPDAVLAAELEFELRIQRLREHYEHDTSEELEAWFAQQEAAWSASRRRRVETVRLEGLL